MTQPTKSQINECLAKFEGWKHAESIDGQTWWEHLSKLGSVERQFLQNPIDYTLDSSLPDLIRVADRFNFWDLQKQENGTYLCYVDDENGTSENGKFVEADTPAKAIALACYEVLK